MSASQLQRADTNAGPSDGAADQERGWHSVHPEDTSANSEWAHFKVYAVPADEIGPHGNPLLEVLYCGIEKLCALIGLILGLPIMLIEGLLIRLNTPGPALFHQRRTTKSRVVRGRDLRHRPELRFPFSAIDPDKYYYVPTSFHFTKFRTMFVDARERFPELYDYTFEHADFYKSYTKSGGEDDPRITRLGRILRALTVDELPNFWFVLIGHMRLVGPRPELVEVVHAYKPEEMYKFAVKPGITGLAQINGRGLLNRGETLKWDLEYVRTRTIWLDIRIICRTLWLVLTRRGAF